MTATDIKVITKQVVINEHMSSHLLPITADERIINLIQSKLTRLEDLEYNYERQAKALEQCKIKKHECGKLFKELKQDVQRYFELQSNMTTDELQNEHRALRVKLEKVGKE